MNSKVPGDELHFQLRADWNPPNPNWIAVHRISVFQSIDSCPVEANVLTCTRLPSFVSRSSLRNSTTSPSVKIDETTMIRRRQTRTSKVPEWLSHELRLYRAGCPSARRIPMFRVPVASLRERASRVHEWSNRRVEGCRWTDAHRLCFARRRDNASKSKRTNVNHCKTHRNRVFHVEIDR